MKDEEIIALAKPHQWNGGRIEGWTFNTQEQLLAFARAVADLQKEKDAKICENEKIDLAATCNIRELTYNAAIEHCINAIRSPETDLDEALRIQ